MNSSKDAISSTQAISLKICGTCARVSFGLTEEESKFLSQMMSRYGLGTVVNWLKMGEVKLCGPPQRLDPQKMRVISIINNQAIRCPATNETVKLVDVHCFLWIPQKVFPGKLQSV